MGVKEEVEGASLKRRWVDENYQENVGDKNVKDNFQVLYGFQSLVLGVLIERIRK